MESPPPPFLGGVCKNEIEWENNNGEIDVV